jgi:hypothetical protein
MKQDSELDDAPPHAILAQPWKYFIARVIADFDPSSQLRNSVELTLVQHGDTVRLRFVGITELEIDAGFPYLNSGLQILDISHLKWDSIGIRVSGFEQNPAIRFWAKSVERMAA